MTVQAYLRELEDIIIYPGLDYDAQSIKNLKNNIEHLTLILETIQHFKGFNLATTVARDKLTEAYLSLGNWYNNNDAFIEAIEQYNLHILSLELCGLEDVFLKVHCLAEAHFNIATAYQMLAKKADQKQNLEYSTLHFTQAKEYYNHLDPLKYQEDLQEIQEEVAKNNKVLKQHKKTPGIKIPRGKNGRFMAIKKTIEKPIRPSRRNYNQARCFFNPPLEPMSTPQANQLIETLKDSLEYDKNLAIVKDHSKSFEQRREALFEMKKLIDIFPEIKASINAHEVSLANPPRHDF